MVVVDDGFFGVGQDDAFETEVCEGFAAGLCFLLGFARAELVVEGSFEEGVEDGVSIHVEEIGPAGFGEEGEEFQGWDQ